MKLELCWHWKEVWLISKSFSIVKNIDICILKYRFGYSLFLSRGMICYREGYYYCLLVFHNVIVSPEYEPIVAVPTISVRSVYSRRSRTLALTGCCWNCISVDATVQRNCCASSIVEISFISCKINSIASMQSRFFHTYCTYHLKVFIKVGHSMMYNCKS